MNSAQENPAGLTATTEHAVARRRSPMKILLAVAVAALLLVIGIAAGLIPRSRLRNELNVETRQLSVDTVAVVSPKPGQSSSGLPIAAEVKPGIETPIYARASGYLRRRLVDIGTHVEAGQLLAEIDTPELEQELDRAQGQLAQAEAALGLSKTTAARWADLLKTASVSEQENAEKQGDFKLKTASAESARAEVRRLERLKSFARITAPFAGTITLRNIDEGDLINAGTGRELFHLAQTRKLRIFAEVPQAMARSIRTGQTAEMTVAEIPGRTFAPRVVRTAGVLAADSRTLTVELELDNSKGEIMAGGYAQVRFSQAKMEAAMTLPASAFLFRAEGAQVAVVKADRTVELRTVKLGRDFGQTIEVLTGVSARDRIIVNPSDSLSTGAVVSVAQADKKEKDQ
jgi:RND family efflux transporter MFP subunit